MRLCLFCLMRLFFLVRQNKIHSFIWADQDWIGLMIFKNFADQDWIGLNFCGSGLDSDWTISQSVHLWSLQSIIHKLISAELPRHDHSNIACSRNIYVGVLCGYWNLIIRSAPKNFNGNRTWKISMVSRIRIRSWSENFAQNIIRSRSENPKPSSYQTPITITIFLPYLLNLVII